MNQHSVLAILSLVWLLGCSAAAPTAVPTETPLPTPTDSPTGAPAPTLEPSPPPTRPPLPSPPRCPVVPPPQASDGVIRIAYVGSDHNLYVQDDLAEPHRLTETGDVTRALISTDGTRIAYVREPDGFPPELWAIRADGTEAHRLLGEPAVESFNLELTTLPNGYGFLYKWIPHRAELLVEVHEVTTGEEYAPRTSGVFRLDTDRLALHSFPGPWESPFSPDGEWFAMPEDDSLTLSRTDGTEERHRVLDGYRFIGISSYSILPPLAWMPDGVRVVFPPHGYEGGLDPREPPFEIWDVPFEGDPAQVDTITEDFDLNILSVYLAPNGQYFAHWDGRDEWSLTVIGEETYRMGEEPLSLVWWNPASTHFLHQAQKLYLSDVCGQTTVLEPALGQGVAWLEVKWLDAARALIVANQYDAQGRMVGIDAYLASAAESSIQLLDESWLRADAALIP